MYFLYTTVSLSWKIIQNPTTLPNSVWPKHSCVFFLTSSSYVYKHSAHQTTVVRFIEHVPGHVLGFGRSPR